MYLKQLSKPKMFIKEKIFNTHHSLQVTLAFNHHDIMFIYHSFIEVIDSNQMVNNVLNKKRKCMINYQPKRLYQKKKKKEKVHLS